MKRALFIFRRDLRLQDNRGLLAALKTAKEVVLAFIFTPEQIEHSPYRSLRCLQFMIESLEDLEKEVSSHQGQLHLFYGPPEKVVETCILNLAIEGVFVNHDYTPYSIQRDRKIATVCKKHGVFFSATHDLLLHAPEEVLKSDGKPYTVFTPFYRNASRLSVDQPEKNRKAHYYSKSISFAQGRSIYKKILPSRKKQEPGGRREGLKILKNLSHFSKYAIERDFPAQDKTTHLSPHLKFNTCSIREIYHAILRHLGARSKLIPSLYWRDFFTLISFYFPHVFKGAFRPKFDKLRWKNNKQAFKAWCEGKTGFPLVDAGMRELQKTGFMHNRARMIVASFLIKELHIHWQWGEKYFAKNLIDYDPAVNNGNWQWAASTGCDAQPYFRIFNPWAQGKKFDPDCEYIKKWIPELRSLSPQVIHNWFLEKNHKEFKNYPPPIVDHSKEAAVALATYKTSAQLRISE